jgi:N-acetylglucosaminyldiphosphoundecaprenol N-acetyl-beta-D-mannosaminyltransferase
MLEISHPAVETIVPGFQVLGVRVDAVQIPDAIALMEQWIKNRDPGRYIAVTGMHGIAEAKQDIQFRAILNAADLVVPDGMPLVWLGRWHKHPLRRRVYGPELMATFCQQTGSRYRHFLYGGGPGMAEALAKALCQRYGIVLAGTYTPPFRPLNEQEEKDVAALVERSAPDVLWVGLGTPKQERWMFEHRGKLKVPLMLGVGAAFDLNSGNLREAPAWMRENGLEWFFRLLVEPRRLWRRYLVVIPKSVFSVSLELFKSRSSNGQSRRKNELGKS